MHENDDIWEFVASKNLKPPWFRVIISNLCVNWSNLSSNYDHTYLIFLCFILSHFLLSWEIFLFSLRPERAWIKKHSCWVVFSLGNWFNIWTVCARRRRWLDVESSVCGNVTLWISWNRETEFSVRPLRRSYISVRHNHFFLSC